MEEVLDIYTTEHSEEEPLICMDEAANELEVVLEKKWYNARICNLSSKIMYKSDLSDANGGLTCDLSPTRESVVEVAPNTTPE